MFTIMNNDGVVVATYNNRSELLTFMNASVQDFREGELPGDGETQKEIKDGDGNTIFTVLRGPQA